MFLFSEWRNFITQAAIHNDSAVEVTNCGKLMASFRRLAYGEYEISKSFSKENLHYTCVYMHNAY